MNATFLPMATIFYNDLAENNSEAWFIATDVLQLAISILDVVLAILFLCCIVVDKILRTAPIILAINSCLSELMLTSTLLWTASIALKNDLQRARYPDSFCVLRCYLIHCGCFLQGYSYLLQAVYRYILILHPSRLAWQTCRTQLILIVITWLFAFVHAIPFLTSDGIVYNADNQVCQMLLGLHTLMIYMMFIDYILPMLLIVLVYAVLFQYVKKMGKRAKSNNTLARAQRNLKMVRRAVLLIVSIIAVGFPFTLFMIMAFFDAAPKYHFRIIFLFGGLSILVVMVALYQFTDPIKTSITKRIKKQSTKVLPIVT